MFIRPPIRRHDPCSKDLTVTGTVFLAPNLWLLASALVFLVLQRVRTCGKALNLHVLFGDCHLSIAVLSEPSCMKLQMDLHLML